MVFGQMILGGKVMAPKERFQLRKENKKGRKIEKSACRGKKGCEVAAIILDR